MPASSASGASASRRDGAAWSKPSLSAYLDARLLPFRYEAVR